MEQDIAYGINVVRQKCSNDPKFKGKHQFLKFCKKKCSSRSGHNISNCTKKRYIQPLEKPKIQKQPFNQAMKGNQNLKNEQV